MTSEEREEATLDFNQLKSCLSSLKDSIKVEQQKAQREIFRSFMGEVLRLDSNDEGFIDLENQYIEQLNHLSDDNNPLNKRVADFVNSDFLYSLLTVKNLRYEREIKSFLKNLQILVKNTTKEASENDMRFIQSFFERGLTDISSNIHKDTIPSDVPQEILDSLKAPIETWFGRM